MDERLGQAARSEGLEPGGEIRVQSVERRELGYVEVRPHLWSGEERTDAGRQGDRPGIPEAGREEVVDAADPACLKRHEPAHHLDQPVLGGAVLVLAGDVREEHRPRCPIRGEQRRYKRRVVGRDHRDDRALVDQERRDALAPDVAGSGGQSQHG